MTQVLVDHQADLHQLFQESIGSISDEMLAAHIITREVQRSPSYDAIISSFESGMRFNYTKADLEEHCKKFLTALTNVGGPLANVAKMIQQEWIRSVNQQLRIELVLLV